MISTSDNRRGENDQSPRASTLRNLKVRPQRIMVISNFLVRKNNQLQGRLSGW